MRFMTDSNENARAGLLHGNTSRRRFLQGTAGTFGAALVLPGIYKRVDTIAKPPDRPAVAANSFNEEQYLLQDEQVINVNHFGVYRENGAVAIRVPPLHDHVITATLNVPADAKALKEAQHHLEFVLRSLDRHFPATAAGVGI